MAGRREQQKQRREQAILRVATRLFESRGFEATPIEAIASGARLAVGTVYNYFPTKAAILLAIVRREVAEVAETLDELALRLPDDPGEAVAALCEACVDGFLEHDRRLWRDVVSAAMASPDTVGRELFAADLELVAHLAAAIRRFQSRGLLGDRFDAGRAALTLYGTYMSWFLAWVTSDEIDEALVRAELRASVEIWIYGLQARRSEASRKPKARAKRPPRRRTA